MKILFEDRDIKQIQESISDWWRINMTPQQVLDLIGEAGMASDIAECGFDTVAREGLASVFCQKLTGKDWPMNQECPTEEARIKFFSVMYAKAIETGYDVHAEVRKEYGLPLSK